MKLRFNFSLLLLLFFSVAFAQQKIVIVKNGTWTFTQYAPNVIKASFKPTCYTTTENVSDAVIEKPQQRISVPVITDGGIVYVGNHKKIKITAPVKKDEFNSFSIELNDSEKIFGGGERALPLNRRGYKFNLYNNPAYGYSEGAENLNYSVPFFTSSNGYGLFFDNASKGYVDIGKTNNNIFEAGFVSGELNVYVILGKDYKEILTSYYKLTGTQPLPPRWALGNFMSRFGYSSATQVNGILDSMKKQDIPVDAIIFDLFWFGDSIKGTMGNLAWMDKTKWADPEKMISNFRKQHINTILITEPFVLKSSLNYEASKQYHTTDSAGNPFVLTDFYFGQGGIIDIFRKDAQQWFWSKYKEQMKIGVEGWWGDLGEPERHPQGIYHNLKDLGFKRLFKADEVHNIYGHAWTKMLFNEYAKDYPNKRLFSLNRAGFAGSQRYSIFPWTGDVSRSWSGLRAQLPVILGMSMSGIPYVHSDAGGFAGGDGDNELYVRWLQFAAFTPLFKPHGTALDSIDKKAFSFPSEAALIAEPYRSYAKEAINLRYSLLPYNYTLAYKQTKYGEPLIAPLYYYYPKDTTAVNIGDEFMWGENILVAPVLHKDEKERKVYLPEGKWYCLSKNEGYDGDQWINEKTTIHNIPFYIKTGSFIPMWQLGKDSTNSTYDYNGTDINILYIPSIKPGIYDLYDDDGITKNAKGELITFKGITKQTISGKNIITIQISSNKPEKYNKKLKRFFYIQLPYRIRPASYIINGKKFNQPYEWQNHYTFNKFSLYKYVKVKFEGKPIKLDIIYITEK